MSEYHPSELSVSEGPSEVPEVGDFDEYVTDVEGKGYWDLSDLIGGPDFGHRTSICVDYDQVGEA